MTSQQKSGSGKGCTIAVVLLVVGFFGLAILGILSAIAIPAFLRYIKLSKVTESEAMVRKIEDSVKSYHLKECKFPANATTSLLVPTGGAKVVPTLSDGGFKQIGMSFSDPLYFRYRLVNEQKTLTIIADANFNASSPENHTFTRVLTTDADCGVRSLPQTTTNEFE